MRYAEWGGAVVSVVALAGVLWRAITRLYRVVHRLETTLPVLADIAADFPLVPGQSLGERIDALERVIDLQSQVMASVLRANDATNQRLEALHRMLIRQGVERRKRQ